MYQEYDMGAYHLYLIPTDRFKRNTVRLVFRKQVEKQEISSLLFLMNVLFEGSKKYPSARLLKIASDNLYAVGWAWDGYLSGNYLICTISFDFLDEAYTEEGMLHDTLSFFHELLFVPNVENGQFDPDTVELVRNRMFEMIETERENHNAYAMKRMLEVLAPDTPLAYSSIGYQEDYEKLTGRDLYQYYQQFLQTFDLDIYVCGHTQGISWKEEIRNMVTVNTLKKQKLVPYYIEHKQYARRTKTVIEKDRNNQSKLVIGCKVEPLTLFERQYVTHVYSYILGGGSDSFLFQNVREKNSLCYSISSGFRIVSNLMVIRAGIDGENLKKTVQLIKKQMKRMENGDFTEELIQNAITIYLEAKYELTDSVAGLINNVSNHVTYDYDLLEKQKENILKVTKEDVIKLAHKIHIDTIYLLEGEE